jgi:hypothetical protein
MVVVLLTSQYNNKTVSLSTHTYVITWEVTVIM